MPTTPSITRILFATDLSENAQRAFAYAASLADAYGARVTVLHVMEKIPPDAELLLVAFLGYRDIEELRQKSERDLIERIKARIERFCTEAGERIPECRFILHDVVVEPGKATEVILRHAGTGDYDVLVLGSRGLGPIQNVLLGGTSRTVIRDCGIPILLVPMT